MKKDAPMKNGADGHDAAKGDAVKSDAAKSDAAKSDAVSREPAPVAESAPEGSSEESEGSGRRSERAPDREAVPPVRVLPGTFVQRLASGDGMASASSPATEPRDGSLNPPPAVEEVIVIEIRPKDEGKEG